MKNVNETLRAPSSDRRASSYSAGNALYRSEAVSRHSDQWVSAMTLVVPVAFKWYSLAVVSLTGLIAAFLILASYATTESFRGVILPQSGVTKILGSGNGTISSVFVKEGQLVSVGDPILTLKKIATVAASDQSAPLGAALPKMTPQTSAIQSPVEPGGRSATIPSLNLSEGEETVRAPVAGLIYQLDKTAGDIFFAQYEPLGLIAPVNGALEMTGYVTSAVQSRLRLDTIVSISLDAFKNEPNGQLKGTVAQISSSPTRNPTGGRTQSAELLYKVTVRIDPTYVKRALHPLLGMQAEFKVTLERRKIYEWLLDPLKTLFR